MLYEHLSTILEIYYPVATCRAPASPPPLLLAIFTKPLHARVTSRQKFWDIVVTKLPTMHFSKSHGITLLITDFIYVFTVCVLVEVIDLYEFEQSFGRKRVQWQKWQWWGRFPWVYCGRSEEGSDVDLGIVVQEGILQSDNTVSDNGGTYLSPSLLNILWRA